MVTVARSVDRALVIAPRTGAHIGSKFSDCAGWTTLCGKYVPGKRATVLWGQDGVDYVVEDDSRLCPDCRPYVERAAADVSAPRERRPRLAVDYDLVPYWLRVPR